MESPDTFTSPGKVPCTLSYLNRCALSFVGTRSLMATNCRSVRLASAAARSTFLPMRPNPEIATFTVICHRLLGALCSVFCCIREQRRGH